MTAAFFLYFHIFLKSILDIRMSQNCVTSLGGVSEQTHENLRRDY